MIRAGIVATTLAMPCTVIAEAGFGGVWQPYSRPVEWLGAMTIAPDRISFAAGPQAQLEPVRDGGSVFRLVEPQGEGIFDCGPDPVNFVGFHVLDNGQLAVLHYWDAAPPAEPTGRNSLEVVRNGACSVMFYAR